MKRWEEKRVVVLGLARQGKALARYLVGEGARVVMSDIKTKEQLGPALSELEDLELTYALGSHPLELLEGAEALFLSGGVPADLPIAVEAQRQGIPLLNDAQLFLELCPAPVIGITGSAGKTTTTTLVDQMINLGLQGSGRSSWLGGNIGRPLLEDLDRIQADDVVVMELSSFQLELMTISPQIAAVLNLTPDHLDRHGNMQAYIDAKRRILEFQDEYSVTVLGYDDETTRSLQQEVRGRVICFGYGHPDTGDAAYLEEEDLVLRIGGETHLVCKTKDLSLRGPHNIRNMLAAFALSSVVGTPLEAMKEAAETFRGVPHRLEFVESVGGADWFNDSIATTPDRALAAIRSFEQPLILLLGGRDKDLPWDAFAREVIARARMIILFGEAVPKLAAAFEPMLADRSTPALLQAAGLEEAVSMAASHSREGDVVLLSPGCTSYDEFPNFEVRGERFRQLVRSL